MSEMRERFGARHRTVASTANSVLLLAVFGLSCGKSSSKTGDDSKQATVAPTAKRAGDGVEVVEITATGIGKSREDAVRDGLIRAIEQVHGRALSISNVSADIGTIEKTKKVEVLGLGASKSEAATVTVGGRQLVESTSGLATSLRIIDESESHGSWTVKVTAGIARYSPPNSKTGIVVAPPKGADGVVVPVDAATQVQEQIGQAIASTPRFALLDRSSNPAVAAELDALASGGAPASQAVMQGQRQVAAFVVQVTVSALRVTRNARMMRTTKREIVQYDGEVAASYRVVHVVSGQVFASGQARATRTSDESLKDDLNAETWKREMLTEVASKMGEEIVDKLAPIRVLDVATATDSTGGFPVTVNAGSSRMKSGQKYDVIVIGAPIKDSESGEVLGLRERPCCVLTTTKIDERVAFGTLDKKPVLATGEVLQVRPHTHD
jgi:hypothetical protein